MSGDSKDTFVPPGLRDIDLNALKSDIRAAVINRKANACPMVMRVAWHASGTWDKDAKNGGSDGGTMRFSPEKDHGANAGLSIIRDMLHLVKKKHPNVSMADLWTYAGVVAIEFMGGPTTPHRMGRTDAPDNSSCPPDGRLPDASQGAQHLRDVFYRQGFNDQEIVALSGGHTVGRCHIVRSGYDGPWTRSNLQFNNEYFRNLIDLKWTRREWEGPDQYQDPSGELCMLPTDIALINDAEFRPWVELYARDEAAFFRDFKAAYGKLLSNGCPAACVPSIPKVVDVPEVDRLSAEFRDFCMHGNLGTVKAKVKAGADVHALETHSGRSALHKAAFWGHGHTIEYLMNDCKLNPDVQDYNGDTAMHDAARFGHVGIVELLVGGGASTSLRNKDGLTAQEVGQQYEKPEVVNFLASRM